MNPISFSIDEFKAFLLILLRIGGIIFSMPLIGDRIVLPQIKIGFVLFLTLLFLPVINVDPQVFPDQTLLFAVIAFKEILIGVLLGYVFKVLFGAFVAAGQLIGFQMGFGIANVAYPGFEFQGSVISAFLNLVAIFLFFSTDTHHLFLISIKKSYDIIPAGGGFSMALMAQGLSIDIVGKFFLLVLQIAMPVTLMLLFISAVLGIISRLIPQINVFIISFPLTIQVGLIMLLLAVPSIAMTLNDRFLSFGRSFIGLLEGMRA